MKSWSLLLVVAVVVTGCLDVSNPGGIQLEKELKDIDAYIKTQTFVYVANGNNQGVKIGVVEFGTGAPPHEGQVINATFIGHLLSDWSVFETLSFNDRVELIPVEGLRYAVESLPEGTAATIFIASNYGFGAVGTNTVPGNATIAYEVVLDKVTKTTAELTQFKSDTTAIHKYLKDSSIPATAHRSGVWYSTNQLGTGAAPNPYSFISFHYKGRNLSTGIVFQEGDLKKQIVFGLIDGLKVGIPLMKVGDTATFYIPSGLGYGPAGTNLIAPNSNLIFEITLNSVD